MQDMGMIHNSIVCFLYHEEHYESCLWVSQLELVIAYLVRIGCCLEHRNLAGETPFLFAAKWCSEITDKLLQVHLDQDADLMAKDANGQGALHLALKNFGREAECILFPKDHSDVENDAGPALQEEMSSDEASIWQDEDECDNEWPDQDFFKQLREELLFLLRIGCDPKAKDNRGRTVCEYADIYDLSESWNATLATFNTERE